MSTKLLTMILIVCGIADLRAQASRVPEAAGPAKAAPEPEEMDEEAGSEEEGDPVVPEDLLEDEHMREE